MNEHSINVTGRTFERTLPERPCSLGIWLFLLQCVLRMSDEMFSSIILANHLEHLCQPTAVIHLCHLCSLCRCVSLYSDVSTPASERASACLCECVCLLLWTLTVFAGRKRLTMPCSLRQACRGTKTSALCQSLLLHLRLVPPVTPFKPACEKSRGDGWRMREEGRGEREQSFTFV